jgi:signal transduction histidine kinase
VNEKEIQIYTGVLVTSIVLGVLILFFVFSIIRQQRRVLQLNRQKVLAEISALENERARVANDLHDEIGPRLSAIKMRINSFDLVEEEDVIELKKTNNQIDEMLKQVREISFGLMPSSLLRKGLVTAIGEFSDNFNKGASPMRIDFQSKGSEKASDDISVHVYRIVQETVQNALKYSQASKIDIIADFSDSHLLNLKISDDGIGFDQRSVVKEAAGFGLRSLLSRTELIGGKMYLETKPGKGVKYEFLIPQKI